MKKVVVVAGLSKLTIPQKIESAKFRVTSMTGNASFTTPNPPLATITANVNALETASIAAAGGGVDETAAMHAKEAVLDFSIKLLAAYVENIANGNPINAEAIALSSGMNIKRQGPPRPNGFRVTQGTSSGKADLRTNSEKRATFTWAMATALGNSIAATSPPDNWVVIGSGTQARFTATGLTAGQRYFFRVAKIDKNGQGPWSDVVSIIVV